MKPLKDLAQNWQNKLSNSPLKWRHLTLAGLAFTMIVPAATIGMHAAKSDGWFGDDDDHRSKYSQRLTGHFGNLLVKNDKNADGYIDASEMDQMVSTYFASFDSDKNGEVNPAEMRLGMKKLMFENMDADGSGDISEDEFINHQGHAKGGHYKKHGKYSGKYSRRMIDRFDEDESGALSLEEMKEAGRHMLDKMGDDDRLKLNS